jgi:hypothetical protein
MRVEVAREAGKAEVAREVGALEARHGSFEALRQRVFVARCSDPGGADDYVVWKALRDEGVSLEERTVFETPDVFRSLTPRRVELLEYLHGNEVPSIKELAAKLRRDYKNTYDDLLALEAWGLVALQREGKNQRPIARVTSLRVTWEK